MEGAPPDLTSLKLRPVETRRESSWWNELIERHHYLGYVPLPGAQVRCLSEGRDQGLSALDMGAAGQIHRLEPRPAGTRAAPGGQQRPVSDPAVGAGAQPGLLGAGAAG